MKKNTPKEMDYIKANRKGSRDAEIALHGRQLNHQRVHKSKKSYSRKGYKAGLKSLPDVFQKFVR